MKSSKLTLYAWIVLAANLLVIAWGAVVRATGSGAGCGRHWPDCNGEVIPRAPSIETLIEFSHRATSGIALLLVVGLLVWVLRAFERGHPARLAAIWSMIFMLGEAAIGAGLVLFELVADNESMARALFMATHLGNTFLLLGALTLTAWWCGGSEDFRLRGHGRLTTLFVLAFLGMILIGMSGAVAALGDTLYPAASLEEALEQDLSPTSHLLIRLRLYHPFIAVAISLLLLTVAAIVRDKSDRRWASAVQVLVFVQLLAGLINVYLLAPVWMQVLHLLLADFLWIALVLTAASSLPAKSTA